MAKVEHYLTRFEEGEFYHVYNRCIDRKPLFKTDENNLFFLKKFHLYLDGVLTIYSYCLLENHFHFLIKTSENLEHYRKANNIGSSVNTHEIISKQFRRFFQCYALSFNKQQDRCGTLFQTPFKRARVKNNQHLIYLIYYIHSNAQKHGLIPDLKNWKWSSYNEILENDNTLNQEIIEWFGDKESYINFHISNFDNL
jgi:putative transposase